MRARSAWLILMAVAVTSSADDGPRRITAMTSGWGFRAESEPDTAWRKAEIPSTFEQYAGIDYDGVGWYRVRVERPALPEGQRAFLRFEAAATEATVTCDGVEVGRHLGGWTPFRCDVTEQVRTKPAGESMAIVVRLDEKVGHNTQGFLPIIQPHYGGLWQGVSLEILPAVRIDDLRVMAIGDPETGKIRVEAPILGADRARVGLSYRRMNEADWSVEGETTTEADLLHADLPVVEPEIWTPKRPALYEVRIRLLDTGDEVITRAAFRSIKADGRTLRLNGQAIIVRGILNWGYYPPRLAPIVDEERFIRDLEFARSAGFNLMKFCLWVPPKRYLELCDERGMLAWVEYPTWHPKFDDEHRADLEREFDEFFAFDRNHPSVILRSLTCETGPSADLAVIQSLYARAKEMIPGSLVEDDSSWIEWQRVFDFHDDHPYGNPHTWVETLARLNKYVDEHGGKPIVLGEAIAADTWPDVFEIEEEVGGERPYWQPWSFEAMDRWRWRMADLHGRDGVAVLPGDSIRYSYFLRKHQIEIYRREVPSGGYVVSALRDFPLAGMGLIDYLDRPKGLYFDLIDDSQADTLALLETPGDRRGFAPGIGLEAPSAIHVSHYGPERMAGFCMATAPYPDRSEDIEVEPGGLRRDVLRFNLAARPKVIRAKPLVVSALVGAFGEESEICAWELWLVPKPSSPAARLHDSFAWPSKTLLPQAKPLGSEDGSRGPVIVARRFNPQLLNLLEAGASVVMLPDGQPGSFATAEHWFLRGGPYIPNHPLLYDGVPRDLLRDLQPFDLAGPVLPRIDAHLDEIDPIMLLWDNHDLREVRTHGLAFETRVGKGRLLVSAFNHGPIDNAAGRWLLGEFIRHAGEGIPPRRALKPETIANIRAKLDGRMIDLASTPWRFRSDPENRGLAEGWQKPETPAFDGWVDLKIDAHWEGQGFETLDGWAWYRTTVDVPADWAGRDIYVSFQGVDDAYELYVNGQKAGEGGDIEAKRTAFEDRTSHLVTKHAKPGEPLIITVRVFDWYGAGGIFRPVLLGTAPIGPVDDWIR